MNFDLETIREFCGEVGFRVVDGKANEVVFDVGNDVLFRFANDVEKNDNIAQFVGTPWHCHDSFYFSLKDSRYTELDSLDFISGLIEGTILICEQWQDGELADRWPAYNTLVDCFKYMGTDEEIRVYRARETGT